MTPPADSAPSLELLDYKLTLALAAVTSIKDDVAALRKAGEDARVELALHDRRLTDVEQTVETMQQKLEQASEKRSGRTWQVAMVVSTVPLSVIAGAITAHVAG